MVRSVCPPPSREARERWASTEFGSANGRLGHQSRDTPPVDSFRSIQLHSPVTGLQLPALQTTGCPPKQTPAEQVSPSVQAFPSLQAVPSGRGGLEHSPVTGSRVPAMWHWSMAVQINVVQAPPLQICPLMHAMPHPPQLWVSVFVLTSQPSAL